MMQITPAQVLTELSHHIGQDNGIHVRDLVQRITGQMFTTEALARKVRQIVTDLRMEGNHICAHPAHGYFMAATPEELQDTCKFLYERAMSSLSQISRMKKISLPDLRGQLHLPT
jgi:hypothetical protein